MSGPKEPACGGPYFSVGDVVYVRCIVNSTNANASQVYGGAGDRVTLTVETPGNIGEAAGVTFTCSPIQCRKAGATYQT